MMLIKNKQNIRTVMSLVLIGMDGYHIAVLIRLHAR